MSRKTADQRDIFDQVMSWKALRPLSPFYRRFKEQLLYLFFGGLTTLLSIGLFWLLSEPLSMNVLLANVISWVVCVAFAYVTNRTWVFEANAHDLSGVLSEGTSFAGGRLGTLVVENVILWVGVDLMAVDSMLVKIVAQVFVVAGNYVISKWFVFKDDIK